MFSYWLSDRGYILRSDALGVPGTEVSNADVGAASECHLVTTAQLRLVVKQTILGERRSENDKRWWSECDILTGVAMWADCGPAAKYWLPVYVYWRMQWLQLSEGGSRSWTEKKGNTHCFHISNQCNYYHREIFQLVLKIPLALLLVSRLSPGILLPAACSVVVQHQQPVPVKTLRVRGAVDVIMRTQGEGEESLGYSIREI